MLPKDVLIAALEAIIAQGPFPNGDWILSSSKLQIATVDGDLTFAISLQSSSHNRSGCDVTCSPYWRIRSKHWESWVRKAKPSWRKGPGSSPFLGDYVRNFDAIGPGLGLQTWTFPGSGPNQPSILAVTNDLSHNVWPIFQAAPQQEALANLVAKTYALHVKPMMWGEYFVAIGRPDLAHYILQSFLALSPSLAALFSLFKAELRAGRPLPNNLNSQAFQKAHELGLVEI
ncbi:hypothetical protein [Microvirga guangxiensis]|uniref:Uncharacterized protein n=1 Tax=Microvirga guangxiensis TaxID=549386 RepID=A0A1G5J8W2_9HYPH|nr:hypothetical protein [Microvirga guangxiensis]SCY84380.1 hypothetical protein SAMN02927923_02559 [Microvirga guangxiensis]